MSGPYDARAVANEILRYARQTGKNLTVMQLIKLVYVANGWSLALLGRQLFEDQIQAWQYGPVIPNVYRAFNRFGSAPITQPAINEFSDLEYAADFEPVEKRLIHSVVDSYGHLHAFELSRRMHEPGTPWTVTMERHGPYSVISPEMIKKHFSELRPERDDAIRR